MKSKKKGKLISDISERAIYILLIIVIVVSVLGTLLVITSIDRVIGSVEESREAGEEVPEFKESGEISIDILPRPSADGGG